MPESPLLRRATTSLLHAALAASCVPMPASAASAGFRDDFEGARRITVPSEAAVALEAWLWRSTSTTTPAAPAVILLHGCSGVYGSNGYGDESHISSRFAEWARRLNAAGIHAMLVDAFSTRDATRPPATARQNYCNDRAATLAIHATEEGDRPRDALAAYEALLRLTHPDGSAAVDPARVAVMGWSHGGSAALAAVAAGMLPYQPFVAAQSFYPGCGLYGAFGAPEQGQSTYRATAPVAVYLGSDDTISRFAACDGHRQQSDAAAGAPFAVTLFEGVGHSFDGARCVQAADGAQVSPWTGARYDCSGSHDGHAFDLHDWRAKLEADRLALCALATTLDVAAPACTAEPVIP